MFFNEELIRLHTESLLNEAENSRLIALSRRHSQRPGISYAVIFVWVGRRLRVWGTRLEQRFVGPEAINLTHSTTHFR
jgi:hypothetical protein